MSEEGRTTRSSSSTDSSNLSHKPKLRQNRRLLTNRRRKPHLVEIWGQASKLKGNMPPTLMHLKVLLPFQVFADKTDVLRIVAMGMVDHLGFCHTASIV